MRFNISNTGLEMIKTLKRRLVQGTNRLYFCTRFN
jgi:hypothetical protein